MGITLKKFFLAFYFEIMLDSHEVAEQYTRWAHVSFIVSPMVISYVPTVQ